MILLHLAAAALYAASAWALWPGSAAPAALKRALPPLAIAVHAIGIGIGIATPQGLDLSLPHALSLVALLTVLVAWSTGALTTLPSVGAVVLPVAAVAALLPGIVVSPHRFPYAGETLATAHIAVALLAYAFFVVAAAQALVMTGLESRLHRGLAEDVATPPLLTLERTLFRLIAVGFALLSLALASGVLFSEQLFGRAFQLTHKNVFAVASWLVFGALVVGRWRYGWRGRKALRWILAGHRALDPRLPRQQVRARSDPQALGPDGRHPGLDARDRARRAPAGVGLLLARRDGDDGRQPPAPQAPRAAQRDRRAHRAGAARADRPAARRDPARQQPAQRRRGDADRRAGGAPVRRRASGRSPRERWRSRS
jgi:ABC-type uncharacterized transport system permease subunit